LCEPWCERVLVKDDGAEQIVDVRTTAKNWCYALITEQWIHWGADALDSLIVWCSIVTVISLHSIAITISNYGLALITEHVWKYLECSNDVAIVNSNLELGVGQSRLSGSR